MTTANETELGILQHRPLQVMQWVSQQAELVTIHVCDDCRIFRQETRNVKDEVVHRDEGLEKVGRTEVECPGLRRRSCEYEEKHNCFRQEPPEFRRGYGPPAPAICRSCERDVKRCPDAGQVCWIHGDCQCLECRFSPPERLN